MAEPGVAFAGAMDGLGFVDQGASRRGGRLWTLDFNRFLTFSAHDFGEELVFSWSFDLGEFVLEYDMQIGAGETTFQELYPRHDVRLPVDADAVSREISRTLGLLRFDLGHPDL
ncbi:MAG: hypothetical protein ACRDUY_03090 [Nitriliruptorales bacterium]